MTRCAFHLALFVSKEVDLVGKRCGNAYIVQRKGRYPVQAPPRILAYNMDGVPQAVAGYVFGFAWSGRWCRTDLTAV